MDSSKQTVRAAPGVVKREDEPAFEERLRQRGIDISHIEPDSQGTVGRDLRTVAVRQTVVNLGGGPVAFDDVGAAVRVGDLLGEGGMGQVRLGQQPSLKRQVAVKQLRPAARSAENIGALLREAWISGSLEHPNIVPIHALCRGEDDTPLLVMKRVEGTSWDDVLYEEEIARSFRIEDPIEWHINVLIRVCHAVHLAHSRGILHLDLKLDNVMVGRFGEVYVVDWGLAASIADDRPSWMLDANEISSIIGTLVHMSPEQSLGEGQRFGPYTDTYLLGAMLHEIVAKQPLHDGDTPVAMLRSAYNSLPREYPISVPRELVSILHKATAREPEDRYQSAEELRLALEAFLRHRSSDQLSREAWARLRLLRGSSDADEVSTSFPAFNTGSFGAHQDEMECRFGFRQALRIWPENIDAQRGLHELFDWMIERALLTRDYKRAAEALDEHPAPDAALKARVVALRAELRAERAEVRELKDLKRQLDIDTHRVTRLRLVSLAGVAWLVWNFGFGYLHRNGILVFGHTHLIVSSLATLAICAVMLYVVRNTLLKTRINRYGLGLFTGGLITNTLMWIGCAIAGVSVTQSIACGAPLYVFFLVGMAVMLDARVWWAIPLVSALVLGVFAFPPYAFEIFGAIGGVIAITFLWIWRRPVASEA
ncbi:MAG: protein kinase [Myxococcales bacterium]|nr:protein kinase [Myxococcales bacterium]